MPLIAREHRPDADSIHYFARVLADQPQVSAELASAADRGLTVIEGHFNGRPLALLLAAPAAAGWQVTALVVHPASRQRGVGATLLREANRLLPGLTWPTELAPLARKAGLTG
ncbi:acetyl-CoA sensor PanZ family protein [Isoalcanivorax indicus]|uniref:acetyl-CoA sensor PanZ family protein n=1 Tax=Isoalcanivorax indicus TaxID=2202653 RepID=UPI000DBAB894|nr:acetyl-CoA sensor PanZ family protein [Isoalcanivorax indicus]